MQWGVGGRLWSFSPFLRHFTLGNWKEAHTHLTKLIGSLEVGTFTSSGHQARVSTQWACHLPYSQGSSKDGLGFKEWSDPSLPLPDNSVLDTNSWTQGLTLGEVLNPQVHLPGPWLGASGLLALPIRSSGWGNPHHLSVPGVFKSDPPLRSDLAWQSSLDWVLQADCQQSHLPSATPTPSAPGTASASWVSSASWVLATARMSMAPVLPVRDRAVQPFDMPSSITTAASAQQWASLALLGPPPWTVLPGLVRTKMVTCHLHLSVVLHFCMCPRGSSSRLF